MTDSGVFSPVRGQGGVYPELLSVKWGRTVAWAETTTVWMTTAINLDAPVSSQEIDTHYLHPYTSLGTGSVINRRGPKTVAFYCTSDVFARGEKG